MIKDPMAELCNIAVRANVMRKGLQKLLDEFANVSPKCEWHLPGKYCCNEHNKRGECAFGICPITEYKKV